jgi:hypothetical protein
MKFKNESAKRLEEEWKDARLEPMVKTIVEDAASYAEKKHRWEFVITSIHRTPAEDAALHASGIHVEWRAVDVRTSDRKQGEINRVAEYVNEKYVYDAARPNMKVCFTEPHGNGVHAHYQVHPHTRLRANSAAAEKEMRGESKTKNLSARTDEFAGEAAPIDSEGMAEAGDRLGVKAAEVWAVLTVETRGCGFQSNRRPFVLYERHVFSGLTEHSFDDAHPDISNRTPGGYGAGGDNQYARLERAIALDRKAALESASWGIGQLMGFNAEIAGYKNVEAMVKAMTVSENEQLKGMVGEIVHNNLHKALRNHDWKAFARGYNGANYEINSYDTRLAAAYAKLTHGAMPDLTIRAAQVYLTYLGYSPGIIDGLPGKFTFAALNDFQRKNKLPISNAIDDRLLTELKNQASGKTLNAPKKTAARGK